MKQIIGKLIWNISEFFNIGLGQYAPLIFAWMIGCTNYKRIDQPPPTEGSDPPTHKASGDKENE